MLDLCAAPKSYLSFGSLARTRALLVPCRLLKAELAPWAGCVHRGSAGTGVRQGRCLPATAVLGVGSPLALWTFSRASGSVMSTHASVWTPRHTHRLWPRKKEYKAPKAQPYVAPPPPPPLKKPPPPAAQHIAAETLVETADELIQQAEELNTSAPPPSLKIQLGTLLLCTEQDMIKKILIIVINIF